MNTFDYTSKALFTKPKELKLVAKDDFSAYLMQRIISFQGDGFVLLMNKILNKNLSVLTPQEIIDLIMLVIPKLKPARLKYIKKTPSDRKAKEEESEMIEILSYLLRTPKQHISELFKSFPDLKETMREDLTLYKRASNK